MIALPVHAARLTISLNGNHPFTVPQALQLPCTGNADGRFEDNAAADTPSARQTYD